MKYSVSDEGIQALQGMVQAIINSKNEISGHAQQLKSAGEGQDLGPHADSIVEAAETIEDAINGAADPIEEIADILKDVADGYEEVIGNDRVRNTMGSRNSASSAVMAGAALMKGQMSSDHGSSINTASQDSFNGFSTGRLDNGTSIIKGEHYEQYIQDYYNYDSMQDFPNEGGPQVACVSPSQIEGVHLSDTDMQNPQGFWGIHNSSKEFHIETASHIPEVQAALDKGVPLETIKSDPVLGKCADNYFDPDNLPRVEKWDDYYVFDGDGRHRIIAARELGHDINVRVMHVRRH